MVENELFEFRKYALSKKLEDSKIKELKNKFAFEPGPYLVRKDKIILSQVACNYYKNIKIDRG